MSELIYQVTTLDHVQGSVDAPITFVEYGDYQCPFCGDAYSKIKHLQKQLGHEMCFVFRNFPLKNVHPYAELAAESAEAANAQGKFWEMHDGIYENQESLGEELIEKLVKKIGLDRKTFRSDLETHRFAEHINKDFAGGVRSGVNGTPAIFVNGRHYERPINRDALLDFLDLTTRQDDVQTS